MWSGEKAVTKIWGLCRVKMMKSVWTFFMKTKLRDQKVKLSCMLFHTMCSRVKSIFLFFLNL